MKTFSVNYDIIDRDDHAEVRERLVAWLKNVKAEHIQGSLWRFNSVFHTSPASVARVIRKLVRHDDRIAVFEVTDSAIRNSLAQTSAGPRFFVNQTVLAAYLRERKAIAASAGR